jgi:exopolysaccharide biosynthesis polyprenyl glycosylphosphotransferase
MEGFYRQRPPDVLNQVGVVVRSTIVAIGVLAAFDFVLRPPSQSRLVFLFMGLIALGLLATSRLVAHTAQVARYRRGLDVRTVLVVGDSAAAKMAMQRIAGDPAIGLRVAGFVSPSAGVGDFGRFRSLGTLENVPHILQGGTIDEVVIALPANAHSSVLQLVEDCRRLGVHFAIVPDTLEMSLSRIDVETLGVIPLLGERDDPLSGMNGLLKRGLDLFLASVALVVFAIPMLVVAIAIRLDSPGKAILGQTRVGKGGRTFACYKFRSMVQNADKLLPQIQQENLAGRINFKSRNDSRRTRVGKVIRRMSMDEAPQLFNVLKGDMSLVGPRPPLPHEFALYETWMRARLDVSPGLTGLWQVSGRSNLVFDEMVLLDLFYIKNWSIGLDIKLLIQTVPAMLSGRGAF